MIYARHSVLKRGCSIWDKSQMPEEVFHARLEEVREEMAQRGLEALMIYGDTWSYADLCYLTHYFPKVRGGLGIIPLRGQVTLLLNIGSRDVPFARSITWVEDVRASAQLGRDGAGILKVLGLEHAKTGLVDHDKGFPLPQSEELKSGLPGVQWEDGSSILLEKRSRKSRREMAILEEAGRILKEICEASNEVVRRGKNEYEIVAEIDRLIRLKGAEDLRILIGDDKLHPPGVKEIGSGQTHLAVYFAIQHHRYWVEAGRTYMLKEDSKVREIYQKAKETLEKMLNALEPGRSTAEVAEIARIQLGELYPPAALYGLGNGIGLSQWEPPFLSEGPDYLRKPHYVPAILEKDMAFTLRAALQAEGRFVLAGDSYQITASGARTLTV